MKRHMAHQLLSNINQRIATYKALLDTGMGCRAELERLYNLRDRLLEKLQEREEERKDFNPWSMPTHFSGGLGKK